MAEVKELPCLSQEIEGSPIVHHLYDILTVAFSFHSEGGELHRGEITFSKVEAYSFTFFEACTTEQVDAYDKIVSVDNSSWLSTHRERKRETDKHLMHFRTFLDDVGCYDVLAARVEINVQALTEL